MNAIKKLVSDNKKYNGFKVNYTKSVEKSSLYRLAVMFLVVILFARVKSLLKRNSLSIVAIAPD